MIIIVIKDEQDVPRLKGIPYLAYIIQQILLMGCQVQDPVECPKHTCVSAQACTHMCVWGRVGGHFLPVSLQLLAQEVPASGILLSVGQGLGPGLWNPGCVRNKQEIAKMPASE